MASILEMSVAEKGVGYPFCMEKTIPAIIDSSL
jgi:hypothetical protein